jgi:GT2 family glycosyltransferase/glycosyltransferase involved in cell wall biosynthesis
MKRSGRNAIVVLGMMSKMPVAGVVWQTIHYLVGLQRLGFEVYYVEAHGRTPSMLMTDAGEDSTRLATDWIAATMHHYDLDGRWAFHALHDDGSVHGLSESRLRGLYKEAAAIINLHGGTKPQPEHWATGRLIYVETDPVQLQVELADNTQETIEFLEPHRAFFTFGENLGNADCLLPVSQRFPFVPTRQPVILDFWAGSDVSDSGVITTVGNWEQRWREVVLNGETYHWSKHFEFLKFIDLPAQTKQPLELALSGITGDDADMLRGKGWSVRDALALSSDVNEYRDYIQRSRGEFTVAKDQNVRLRSGWFSDRSATYLAAGRPVITQETGFSNLLPTGAGLFGFTTTDEALAAIERVRTDPRGAGRAASEVAREFFDHEVVLRALCERSGIDVPLKPRSNPRPQPDFEGDLTLQPVSKRPLRLPPTTRSQVLARDVAHAVGTHRRPGTVRASVVVVTHDSSSETDDKLVVTRLCIESLLRTIPPDTEVVVVDNASTAATITYLRSVAAIRHDVRLIENAQNEGFARAVNAGLAASQGETLAIINDDVVLTPGWLARLQRHLEDGTIGLVGPTTNHSSNEARVPTSYTTYGGLVDVASACADQAAVLDAHMLTLFCAAMRRQTWAEVGPLDERFEVGMFEDDDYSRRIHAAGMRTVCAEDVFVHHFGEATIGDLVPTGDYKRLFDANRERYEGKWNVKWTPHRGRSQPGYDTMVKELRQAVATSVPPGKSVAVISRGDDALLKLGKRPAFHMPRTAEGAYSGDHPADSAAAIASLDELMQLGCSYLVVPATERWWLDHYSGLADYLTKSGSVVSESAKTGTVFRLGRARPATPRRPVPNPRRARQQSPAIASGIPAACTIVARNYLSHARVLAASYYEQHPEGRFYLLVVDGLPAGVEPGSGMHLVQPEELEIPHLVEMCFKYDVTEFSTAVKPSLLRALIKRYGERRVMYIDPDILIARPMAELIRHLDRFDIVLTPHLDHPIPLDGKNPSEMDILIAGAYNLGFIALKETPETDGFLEWWEERLRDHCRVDPASGLMTDQKWIDLVPSLFPSTGILRDVTYNAGYWNLHSRRIGRDGSTFTVNGEPLTFYHFSGFNPARPKVLSKHQNRSSLEAGTPLFELFNEYRVRHLEAGHAESSTWKYGLAMFDNGVTLDPKMRRLYFDLTVDERARFGDPRATAGAHSFLDWATTPVAERRNLSPFLERVYRDRYDVASAFPDVGGRDREAFLHWARTQGAAEMGYDPGVVRSSVTDPTPTGPIAVHRDGEPTASASTPSLVGVNVCGYIRDESGVGQVARSFAGIIRALGAPHALHDISHMSVNRSQDDTFAAFDAEHPHQVNLVCVNADQHFVLMRERPALFEGRYNIGCWSWELATFPPEWLDRFPHYNEIWLGSSFMANAISRVSPIPVVRIPTVVKAPTGNRPRGRRRLGARPTELVYLFAFDTHSYFERKNPLAVVEAFRRAFPKRRGARLVIKCVNGATDTDNLDRLRAAMASVDGTLISDYLSRAEHADLVSACDVYVSLHRAEGFGLTIAEAMAAGKPVIATDWSGNTDFADVSNSYPVRYDLTTIARDVGPYRAGETWAEPSVEHAAELMQRVADDRSEAAERGIAASATMRSRYTIEAIAPLVADRLAIIGRRLSGEVSESVAAMPPRQQGNRDIIDPIRRAVAQHVPEGSNVIVVSKGDDELVALEGRNGWHYPQNEQGVYAGYYPATAADAIAHLEFLREKGGEFLLIPATSSWWLSYYSELRSHLETIGERIVDDRACTLYKLARPAVTLQHVVGLLEDLHARMHHLQENDQAKGQWIADVAERTRSAHAEISDLAGKLAASTQSLSELAVTHLSIERELGELRALQRKEVGPDGPEAAPRRAGPPGVARSQVARPVVPAPAVPPPNGRRLRSPAKTTVVASSNGSANARSPAKPKSSASGKHATGSGAGSPRPASRSTKNK